MLAYMRPISLVSGLHVSLQLVLKDANRNEFHHLYPRAYLKQIGIKDESEINALVNFCFLSKTDNNRIGGSAPSVYKDKLTTDAVELNAILNSSLIPDSLFADNFEEFVKDRSEKLLSFANGLVA